MNIAQIQCIVNLLVGWFGMYRSEILPHRINFPAIPVYLYIEYSRADGKPVPGPIQIPAIFFCSFCSTCAPRPGRLLMRTRNPVRPCATSGSGLLRPRSCASVFQLIPDASIGYFFPLLPPSGGLGGGPAGAPLLVAGWYPPFGRGLG